MSRSVDLSAYFFEWLYGKVLLQAKEGKNMLSKQLKVYESSKRQGDPCILLQGKWVRDLGFQKGANVDILYNQGQISIVLIKDQNPPADLSTKKRGRNVAIG